MNIVVAVCKNNGIGFKNRLPWTLKNEINYFKHLTIGNGNNAVIMGKNTWLGFNQALPKRDNFVLSKKIKKNIGAKDFYFFNNFSHFNYYKYDDVWAIGGQKMYESVLDNNLVSNIFLTEIENDFECDTFFPDISLKFNHTYKSKPFIEKDIKYTMNIYSLKRYDKFYYDEYKQKQVDKLETAINKL
tara:strand:+ start:2498 stop:3058 length:561 start_codon:yes stop_codon:yes gene_type:complete